MYQALTERSSDECIICLQTRRVAFRAPCGHPYCRVCLVGLAEACTRDESLFPLRCCRKEFTAESIAHLLPADLRTLFREKSLEFGTPASQRIYCVNPHCSIFLGSSGETRIDIVCGTCETIVCSGCKSTGHPRNDCAENASLGMLRELASTQHWQTCPGCGAIVELSQGCYHMTCRCRYEFCYLCAERWKSCQCVQWNEDMLIADAERRVINEHGAHEAAAQPARHADRVLQVAQQLRTNHDCYDHRWAFRHGAGSCETCNDWLPVFLMVRYFPESNLHLSNPHLSRTSALSKMSDASL